ncbi:hypothetical protein [Nocardia jejuensis]|uniref:hypothetical protein n=1 Tax=Nocardia jejuensis TaxID=328049 RepID=UPI00083604DB|nr:hypothetical protein [Nocardia jejuensis]
MVAILVAGLTILAVRQGDDRGILGGRVIEGTALPADNRGVRTSASPTTAPPKPTSEPSLIAALTPGWQAGVLARRNAGYDVPPDWTVRTQTTVIGFEGGGKRVLMGGTATMGDRVCGDYHWRAVAGLTGSKLGDAAAAAHEIADTWSRTADLENEQTYSAITLSAPEQLTVQGRTGALVTASFANAGPYDCQHPPTSVLHALAMPADNGQSVVMVIYADQGVADAPTAETMRQMLTTLRPAGMPGCNVNDLVGNWC